MNKKNKNAKPSYEELEKNINELKEEASLRKKTEEELLKSKERYKNLYNNAEVALFRTRISDGKILEANELCAELAGFDNLDEFLNEWIVSEHYDDPADRDRMIKEIMEKGEVKNFEALGRVRNGKPMWLSYSARVYPEEGYLEGAFYDITDRKKAEEIVNIQREIAIALNSAASLKEGLTVCLDKAIEISDMDSGGIYLFDKKTGDMKLFIHKGLSPGFVETISKFSYDSENIKLILAGEPAYPIYEKVSVYHGTSEREEGLKGIAILPIKNNNKIIACLNLASHTLDEVPTACRTGLETIASQMKNAIIRLQTETALKESESKYSKAFMSNASLMSISTLEEGRFLEVNDEFLETLGYNRDELIGNTAIELGLFADKRQRKTISDIAKKTGNVKNYEIIIRKKSGELRFGLFSANVMEFEGQTCWFTVVQDITERVQTKIFMHAQHELGITMSRVSEIEDALAYVIEAATVHIGLDRGCIYLRDPETGSFDLAYSKNFSSKFIKSNKSIVSDLDWEYILKYKNPIYRTSENISLTLRKEGIITIAMIPVLNQNEVIAFMAIASDTIEDIPKPVKDFLESIGSQVGGAISRIMAEEALRKEKEKVQKYINVAGVMFVALNSRQEVTLINPRGCEMLEHTEEEIIGKNWFDNFLPEGYREKSKNIFNQLISGNIELIEYSESMIITSQGTERIVAWHNTVLKDGDGNTIGTLSSGEDITQRKQAEEQIKNHNTLLQDAIKKREQELEQLMAKHLRIEKLATIGQVYANIAHEIRNPLGAIKQSVFFINRKLKEVPDKIKEHLELIDNELVKTNNVISNMLNTLDTQKADSEIIGLYSIITEAASRCRINQGITLNIDISPEKYQVKVNALQLQQVFINLITNSIQSITEKGTINIGAKKMPKEKKYIVIIKDNGCGIKKDVLEKVFNPLFTTKDDGTGLGLGICKQIIEGHGGELDLQSRPGEGTIVNIVLPIP